MGQSPQNPECASLWEKEQRLNIVLGADDRRLLRINSRIHALGRAEADLREERRRLEAETPRVMVDPVQIGRDGRRPTIKPGNPVGAAVSLLSDRVANERDINQINSELAEFTSERDELFEAQTRAVRLRDETLADRAEVRREQARLGCPGARSNFF